MKNGTSRAPRGAAHRAVIRVRAARRLTLFALLLALATPAVLFGVSRAVAQRRAPGVRSVAPQSSEPNVTTETVKPVSVTTVSLNQLAARQASSSRASVSRGQATFQAVRTLTAPDSAAGATAPNDSAQILLEPPQREEDSPAPNPLVASPAPAQAFLAQEDGPKTGTLNFIIPPSPTGAVGFDKVFTNTNSNYRVHDKATGAALSTVSIDDFWSATGGAGFFDPQAQFDPYNQRWILAVVSNPASANSSIEVAVSQTSDPQGSYNLYRFNVAATIGGLPSSADFPMLGFNKNWIAVGYNMFTNSTNANNDARILVLDYPAARAGTLSTGTTFSGFNTLCEHPVTTYSATENNLYVVKHVSSASGAYRVETISGTPSSPVLNAGTNKARPGGGWIQPSGDILPQQCVTGSPVATYQCPASPRFIAAPDSQVRSNPVFRDGKIYYAQTVGVDTNANSVLDHTAAQWTVLDASAGNFANFLDGGRVEDATANGANGGHWYAYPSINVNKNGDVMLGFSEFQSNDYADAGYAFRLASDAPGTMRDPVTYKEGEDYYEKTFGGTSNLWGAYSHTVVDPSNDRDLWTIEEYAQARVSATNGLGTNDSRWGTYWARLAAPAGSGELIISEFRLNGPAGSTDEFVEIYNNTDAPITVTTVDGSAGYALAASDGVARFTIPGGTNIPARGHYLGVNSGGYSLSNYPAGAGTTATGDATYTTDIPVNAGIALFSTATPANFSAATRLDAAGSTSESNTLYKEGAGYPAITTSPIDYSFNRDQCGKGGSVTQTGGCPQSGLPKDTNNNASDFVFQDTQANPSAAGQRLGAPGPENLSSPVLRNSRLGAFLLDATTGSSSAPNRVRDFTAGNPNTSGSGTLSIRRRFVNNTGSPVTRLRFRIIDVSTFPSSSTPGFADLRAITSGDVVVSNIMDNATCAAAQTPPATPPTAPCTVTVHGTTLEESVANTQQPFGGGLNASLSVTLPAPLAPGASVNLQYLLGVQSGGTFKFFVNIEALP